MGASTVPRVGKTRLGMKTHRPRFEESARSWNTSHSVKEDYTGQWSLRVQFNTIMYVWNNALVHSLGDFGQKSQYLMTRCHTQRHTTATDPTPLQNAQEQRKCNHTCSCRNVPVPWIKRRKVLTDWKKPPSSKVDRQPPHLHYPAGAWSVIRG